MRSLSSLSMLRQGTPLALLALLSMVAPDRAVAQCTISGSTTLCGGSTELCGPEGPYEYMWTGPDGSSPGDQRCWTVTLPGTYRLTTFDFINGLWAGPCEVLVTSGETSSCATADLVTGCEGAPVTVCGPTDGTECSWTGPDGFASSSACIEVTVAGDYALRTRSSGSACWSQPCVTTVTFSTCLPAESCPLTALQWSQECRLKHRFDATQMTRIAGSVAQRSPLCGKNLCRVLSNRSSLEARARRQLAAVHANIAARELGLLANGAACGLDPEAAVSIPGFTGTVASWARNAEERLVQLAGRRRTHEVKRAYRDLITAGWRINHGVGMEVACGEAPRPGVVAQAEVEESESLASELADDQSAMLAIEALEPNPTAGSARIAFAIASAEDADVFLGVYDVSGRLLRTLAQGPRTPGRHEVRWDGRDAAGRPLTNGAYFVVGRVGAEKVAARLVMVR